jgi:hypothetical protein
MTIKGSGFGAKPGYVLVADCGINWGGPGDIANFKLVSWSETAIEFEVPKPDSKTTPGFTYAAAPGTVTVAVTTVGELTSNQEAFSVPFVVETSQYIPQTGQVLPDLPRGVEFEVVNANYRPWQFEIAPGTYWILVLDCGSVLEIGANQRNDGYAFVTKTGSNAPQTVNSSPAQVIIGLAVAV